MLDALRPFLAALLMLPLRALAGWLTARGIEITTGQVDRAVEAALVWGIPLLSTLGVVGRRLFDKRINPDNAASTGAVMAGKAKQRQRKQTRAVEDRLQKAGVTDGEGEDPEAPKWYRPPGE